MKRQILAMFSLILASCSSDAALLSIDENSEVVKLENRRERWVNADKCLRAMVASISNPSSNVDELR